MKKWDPDDWALILVASVFPLVVIGMFALAIIAAATS